MDETLAPETSASLLTVCIDRTVAQDLLAVAESFPWTLHTADFETYLSPSRRPHLTQQVRGSELCVAIVNFDVDRGQAVDSAIYLQQMFAGKVTIVALAGSREPALLLAAMRCGCTEFLDAANVESEFANLLDKLDVQRLTAEDIPVAEGSVLSFFGAKGGVGATTLAVHLALYLLQVHRKRVLLIDNQPELGHVCVYLGLDGARYNFHELVRNVNRLDSELLRGFTAKHPSGLEVLSSPDVCGGSRPVDPDLLTRLLDFLRSEYDFVLIDSQTSLNDASLAVIAGSTQVYLVATPEISAIRDLSRYVDNLMRIEYTTEKMHVVINRFSSRYAVEVEDIEKAIRLPVAIRLPNSYTELVRSVNLGEPIAPNRKSEFSAQFLDWAERLAGAPVRRSAVRQTVTSLFARLRNAAPSRKKAA